MESSHQKIHGKLLQVAEKRTGNHLSHRSHQTRARDDGVKIDDGRDHPLNLLYHIGHIYDASFLKILL